MKIYFTLMGWLLISIIAVAQSDNPTSKGENPTETTSIQWLDSLMQKKAIVKELQDLETLISVLESLKKSVNATYLINDAKTINTLIDELKEKINELLNFKETSELMKKLDSLRDTIEKIEKIGRKDDVVVAKDFLKKVIVDSVQFGGNSNSVDSLIKFIETKLDSLKAKEKAKTLLPAVDKLKSFAVHANLTRQIKELEPLFDILRNSISGNIQVAATTTKPDSDSESGNVEDKSSIQIAYTCSNKEIYITIDTTDKYFTIGIADASFKRIGLQRKFLRDYSDEDVDDFLKGRLKDECYAAKRALLLRKIRDYIDKFIQSGVKGELQSVVDSLTAELNKDVVAGQFHSMGREIPVEIIKKNTNLSRKAQRLKRKINDFQKQITDLKKSEDTGNEDEKKSEELKDTKKKDSIQKLIRRKEKRKEKKMDKLIREIGKTEANNIINPPTKNVDSPKFSNAKFIVEKLSVKTDYNRISRITIVGNLRYKKYDSTITKQVSVTNNYFSLSLVGLNQRSYTVVIPNEEKKVKFIINYSDVINYEPYEGVMTYVVANEDLNVPIEGYAKINRRHLGEFTSFRTLLDPLGFLGNNPNGFAQLEADAILPMGRKNYRSWNVFPQATFNFSYIYSNSINNEPRIAPVYSLRNKNQADINNPLSLTGGDTSRFINNLDYVRYSYYNVKAHLSLVALELKRWNSWLHTEFGFIALGSKVDTAVSKSRTIHKFIPEARIRLEIRPELPVGASISAGLAWLGNSHIGNNEPTNINDISFLYKSQWAIPHEVMVYAVLGTGSSGLFFKYAGWIGFHQRLADGVYSKDFPVNVGIRKSSYFPQVLLGYSTNLGALVKKDTSK